jgi:predicted outer membrane repeat protein
MRKLFTLTLLLFLASFFFSGIRADILYVKPGTASTAWQGKSHVYSDLQAAMTAASAGDSIWVAAGTYKPTDDGDRSISFELKDDVKYYGGFSGDETELSQRDWNQNETILSGDIGEEGNQFDNTYNVVIPNGTESSPVTEKTRLDGFIVEKGYANGLSGTENAYGGGLYLKYASPIFINCHFRFNYSGTFGGAVYGDDNSEALFGNCVFSRNKARFDGGAVDAKSSLKFFNCVWYLNKTERKGDTVDGFYISIYNSIGWMNSDANGMNDFGVGEKAFSIFQGGSGNNISENPQFIDAENGDFRLRKGSPATNNGSVEDLPDWLTTDYSGRARTIENMVDIGVFEGAVSTPTIKSPIHKQVFDADVSGVMLKWDWNGDAPENISEYEVEFIVNESDTFVVSQIQQMNFSLSGLEASQKVEWRVRGVEDSGKKNWSERNEFFISRGHPIYV